MPEDKDFKNMRESNTWSRYEIYIMETLAQLKSDMNSMRSEMRTEMGSLRNDLAEYKRSVDAELSALKVKVGAIAMLAGVIGGMVPVAVALLVK